MNTPSSGRSFSFTEPSRHRSELSSISQSSLPGNRSIKFEFLSYDLSHIIGEGSYGDVYKGKYKELDVAIKRLRFKKGASSLSASQEEKLNREVKNLMQKQGNHLVELLGCDLEQNCIIFELGKRGSLYDLMKNPEETVRVTDWGQRLEWLVQTAEAMILMHCIFPFMAHRDLRPQNIFIAEDYSIKVGDFGEAMIVEIVDDASEPNDNQIDRKGNYNMLYQAPEVINGTVADYFAADIYSFGLLIRELLTFRMPYDFELGQADVQQKYQALISQVEAGEIRVDIHEDRSRLPGKWNSSLEALVVLMRQCTQFEVSNRPPGFVEIYKEVKRIRDEYCSSMLLAERNKKVFFVFAGLLVLILVIFFILYIVCTTAHDKLEPETVVPYIILLCLVVVFIYPAWKFIKNRCCMSLPVVRQCTNSESIRLDKIEKELQKKSNAKEYSTDPCMDKAVIDVIAESYQVPNNYTEVLDGLFLELGSSPTSRSLDRVRRIRDKILKAGKVDQSDWKEFIRACLKSTEVMRTQTWDTYDKLVIRSLKNMTTTQGEYIGLDWLEEKVGL